MRRMPSSSIMGAQRLNDRFRMDGLAWFMLFATLLTGLFTYTQAIDTDAVMASKAIFMPVFAFPAMLLRFIATGWPRPMGAITPQGFLSSAVWGAVAYAGLLTVAVVPSIASLSSVSESAALFYFNMAIVEEVFFSFVVLAVIAQITRYGLPGALLMTAPLFAIFHIGVYGVDWQFFAVSFCARIILSLVYYMSGSLSAVMIGHGAFNIMATQASIVSFGSSPAALAAMLAVAAAMCAAKSVCDKRRSKIATFC